MKSSTKKVILAGQTNTGKSSLLNHFLFQKAAEKYTPTLGVKIERKKVRVDETYVNLILWDIAGESSLRDCPQSYFLGVSGVIYVTDLTNPAGFFTLNEEIQFLEEKLPGIPVIVAANKSDLIPEEDMDMVRAMMPVPSYLLCSARSGKNVENLFLTLAEQMMLQDENS